MRELKGKWKAFQVLNYINIAIWLIILAMVIANLYDLSGDDLRTPWEMYLFMFLSVVAFLFCFLNIHILQKYFPTQKISGFLKASYVISIVFWVCIFLLFMIAFFYGFNQEFISKERSGGVQGKMILFIVGLLMTGGLLQVIWQIQLMGFLRKNHELEIERIVDSIGSEKN